MKKETHQILSLGLAIFIGKILNYNTPIIILLSVLAWFSGLMPDLLDWKYLGVKHRSFITHSPITFMIVIFFSSIWFVLSFFGIEQLFSLSILCVIFYELHILLDSLNPSGIPILPMGKQYTFNVCNSDNFEMNMLITIIGIALGGIGIFWI